MSAYRATVVREGNWWVISVDGVGVTQARRLAEVEDQAVGLVEAMVGEADASVDVALPIPADLRAQVDEARQQTAAAARAQREAAALARSTVLKLVDAGMPQADVATVLGVSRQRVTQLVGEAKGHHASTSPTKSHQGPREAGAQWGTETAGIARTRNIVKNAS